MEDQEKVATPAKRTIGLGALMSSEEVKIGINHFETHEPVGDIVLRVLKMPTIDKYRDLNNGTGRRKADKAAARSFLFKKAFIRFEPLPDVELDRGGHPDDLSFFLALEMLVDRVLIEYLDQTYPDLDAGK